MSVAFAVLFSLVSVLVGLAGSNVVDFMPANRSLLCDVSKGTALIIDLNSSG